MNSLKSYLYILLGLLCLVLLQFYFQETQTSSKPVLNDTSKTVVKTVKHHSIEEPNKKDLVTMSNDFINATFDLKGGKVVKTELNKYFKTIARNSNQTILDFGKEFTYYAQSGFLSRQILLKILVHCTKLWFPMMVLYLYMMRIIM